MCGCVGAQYSHPSNGHHHNCHSPRALTLSRPYCLAPSRPPAALCIIVHTSHLTLHYRHLPPLHPFASAFPEPVRRPRRPFHAPHPQPLLSSFISLSSFQQTASTHPTISVSINQASPPTANHNPPTTIQEKGVIVKKAAGTSRPSLSDLRPVSPIDIGTVTRSSAHSPTRSAWSALDRPARTELCPSLRLVARRSHRPQLSSKGIEAPG